MLTFRISLSTLLLQLPDAALVLPSSHIQAQAACLTRHDLVPGNYAPLGPRHATSYNRLSVICTTGSAVLPTDLVQESDRCLLCFPVGIGILQTAQNYPIKITTKAEV